MALGVDEGRLMQSKTAPESTGVLEGPGTADRAAPISFRRLTKRYGESVLAVDDLSFSVGPGQVFGLLGPNGAGKTTALRILLGLVHPTAGEARIFGERMTSGNQVLRRVGALVEGPAFVPHLSGIDNLKAFWEAGGQDIRDANLDEALDLAGLGKAIDRKV